MVVRDSADPWPQMARFLLSARTLPCWYHCYIFDELLLSETKTMNLITVFFLATLFSFYCHDRNVGDLCRDVTQIGERGAYSDAREAYHKLFAIAIKENKLSELVTHEEDSIAIQSAWKSVAQLIIQKSKQPHVVKREISWFIGFLEGRANVRGPDWWKNALLNGTILSTDDVVRANPVLNNGRFVYDEGYDRFVLDGQTFHARHGSSIEGFEDGLQFAIGDEFVKLPREIKPNLQQGGSFKLPKEIQYANQFLSGCFNGDHCFLAIHNMYGYPHVTCCIDKNNVSAL